MSDLHRTASSGLFAVMGLSLESIDHYLSSGASLIAIVAGAPVAWKAARRFWEKLKAREKA